MCWISVIVPVYNVEKYLEDCIESILGQDFTDFEVILVDDGSPDESGKICDEYSKKDGRVKVIHKENGGLSSARNAGIKAAQGNWIVFIDSDDFFNDMSFFTRLHNTANTTTARVITYGTFEMRDVDKAVIGEKYSATDKINDLPSETEKLSYLVEHEQFSISAWLHACNCEFVKQRNLLFDENLKTGEDIDWSLRLFLETPGVVGLAGTPYTYRIRKDSICTSKKKSGFWKMRYAVIKKALYLLHTSTWSNKEKKPIYQYLAYTYYVLLGEVCDEPNAELRKQALREVREFDELRMYQSGKKVNLSRAVVKIFGVAYGAKILNVYIHLRARQKKQSIVKE